MKSFFCFFPLLVILFFSCTSKNQNQETPKNILSVESTSPSLGDAAWSISKEPELVIGLNKGDSNYQLYRVFDAIQLSDSSILISNSGTHELRFYTPDGSFKHSAGRQGRGPGDFGDFSTMRLYRLQEDTFVVDDARNNRVQIFDKNGKLLKVNTLEKMEGIGNPKVWDIFSDGSWFIWAIVGSAALNGKPGDIIQMDYGLHRLHPDFSYDTLLFTLPSRPRYVHEYQGKESYPYIPLTPDLLYITDSQNGALFSHSAEPVIKRVDTTGSVTHIFEWEFPQQPTSDIWERYKEEYYLSELSGERKLQYKDYLNKDLPIPDKVPALADIMIDRIGHIWVQRFTLSWEDNTTWDILNPRGKWLTSIQIPGYLNITEIGPDYILAVSLERGFTQVVKYSLSKSS